VVARSQQRRLILDPVGFSGEGQERGGNLAPKLARANSFNEIDWSYKAC
jgi:hypothetical protein